VQKILVTIPKKYGSKILVLEESKDLSTITLGELINALQAREHRRIMRQKELVQGAFRMKAQNSRDGKDKKNNKWKNKKSEHSNKHQDETFPPCSHFKMTNHPQARCWWRPNVKCKKCGNIGHVERICKFKPEEAKVTTKEQEDEEFK